MKESESSFDVTASVKELRALVGGHIDKVYHPTLDHLVLAIRLPGEGKSYVHFWIGKWLYRSNKAQDMPQQPSNFAMMLRKRISNARILDIRQQGFDRIAVMSLEKEEKFDLVLEMFADGNIILIKDRVIVQPLTTHTWKHRDVRAKKEFMFPPPVPDPARLTREELLDIFRNSDTDMVRTLATKLNTGGRYSEEICSRAGMDRLKRTGEATLEDAENILRTIASFTEEIASSRKGFVVSKGGIVEDVVPVRMKIYERLDHEEFATFSEAIESYKPRVPKTKKEKPKETVLELDRLKRKLAQQKAAARTLQDEARETQITGDFVFTSYAEVAKVLSEAKDNMLESKDMTEISGFIGFNPRLSLLKVRVKNIELELDVKGSVQSNAQRYYEGAKRARKKLEGVIAALETAKKEISEQERGIAKAEEPARATREPTKKFWFERFRWFVSSEGAIVLGGKDAKSNDMLVKKHLEPGDRYAHADVHGAPSVVVKMKEGVTDKTLFEACEFAVATSKAWNAKIGSAAGYWVLPEQVSKTPQTGEYLAKGAFVIRGKRNYSGKLEIKLGIGEIEFEGHRKVMCAPESAIRAHSNRFAVIRPGERERNSFSKQLAEIFNVPIEEIQSIMPPGDVKVAEQAGLVIS
ncbi:MAG: ribosome rescue protein RqcH [Thermoplasmatota archaeon]|nr:NFACT family protein [Candidatus Thermoplasmatota archaeon]MBU1914693.1 NFACT family protein [Candidatus Thermoplasmatota archaeon]